jgi:hypothetical protein
MTGADWVGIIGAIGTAGTALLAGYAAIHIKRTHVLVNSRTDAMLARQAQLELAMRKSGVEVPPDPSLPSPS